MKRLYFTTESLDSAEAISDDVHKEGISDWNFHVMSKDEAGLYKRHIHSTNIYHENNILQQAQRGGLIGASVGAMLVIITNFSSIGIVSLPTTLAMILFLMFSGSWFGGFVGIHQQNYKISKFHDDLQMGKYLVMIDVKKVDVKKVEHMMEESHHEAKYNGSGSTMVAPF
ncbi:MAG: hypothetical protein ACI9FJ_001632 [Alteromonadaceae bacterium]|jgi:hypothetical protein